MIVSEARSVWEPDRCARTWAAARAARVHARNLSARSAVLRAKLEDLRHELDDALAHQSRIVRSIASTVRTGDLRAGDETFPPYGFDLPLPGPAPLTEADLEAVADDVIAAYRTAVQRCDDDATTIFASVLREIGRHLAVRIGPKAAGVLLN